MPSLLFTEYGGDTSGTWPSKQKKGINALFIIIHFPGGFFHVFLHEQKKNRSGRKISSLPPWRLNVLIILPNEYSFKHIKGSKRHETHVHVIWDTQCKLCMTWTVQIKTYGSTVLNTVACYPQWWSIFAQVAHLNKVHRLQNCTQWSSIFTLTFHCYSSQGCIVFFVFNFSNIFIEVYKIKCNKADLTAVKQQKYIYLLFTLFWMQFFYL